MLSFRPARLTTHPPGATLGPRTLSDFEFVWVTRGRAEWTRLDAGETFVLEPGTLLLSRPGIREAYRWGRDESTQHGFIHFDLRPRPDTTGWPLVRVSRPPSPIPALLDYLVWLPRERPGDWQAQAAPFLETLLHCFVEAPLPEADTRRHPALAAAFEHVRAVWRRQMRPIALAELAGAACVSKEHLMRLFREEYGTGVVGALELVRLARAAALLERTNLRVGEVAASCGFRDPLYFSRRFRAAYGVPPRAYRAARTPRPSPLEAAGLLGLAADLTA